MRLLSAIVLGLSLSTAACRHEQESARVKEFVPTPKDLETEEIEDFKLSLVADIPQKVTRGVPEFDEELASENDQFDPFSSDHKVWRVSFGQLTPAQFQKLQATYYKNPLLKYSKTRSYELIDFMPPQIQALSGLRFNGESVDSDIPAPKTKRVEKPVVKFDTLSNCWNMAYEILRADPKMTSIYYVDGQVIDSFFTNPKYLEKLSSYSMKDNLPDVAKRNEGLKPFDQMLVYSEGKLLHIATYIDQDFFFEKTGPDDLLNYRFVRYSEIAETYLTWDNTQIQFVRFKPQVLPHASEFFSLKAQGAEVPKGFISEEYLASHPDFYSKVSYWSPRNWEEVDYRSFYAFADVPLEYDAKLNRYKLNKSAFKAVLKAPASH